jgi:hypothetical protein
LTGDVLKNNGYAGKNFGGGVSGDIVPNYTTMAFPTFGAVPASGGDFMPVGTDFSAFGK